MHTLPRLGDHPRSWWKGWKSQCQAVAGCNSVSGHDRTAIIVNSRPLSFLPKSRQPTFQHGAGETYKPPALNEKLLMADGFYGRGAFSSCGVPWQVNHTPVDGSKHTSIQATQIELLGGENFLKGCKVGRGGGKVEQRPRRSWGRSGVWICSK